MSGGLLAGVCSVSFRGLDPDAVVALAVRAQLEAVEWGADVHVPPGCAQVARALGARCADAGLRCPSYGSYFFAGRSDPEELGPLTENAHGLGCTLIRVWAPFGIESDAPPKVKREIARGLAEACRRAEQAGLSLALEFHPGTLTHTAASTRALLEEVDCPELRCYWQPESGATPERSLAEFRAVRECLANLHVFAWTGTPPVRLPLADHATLWRTVLAEARGPEPRAAYLEFVRDDDEAQLLRDASTLRGWLAALG